MVSNLKNVLWYRNRKNLALTLSVIRYANLFYTAEESITSRPLPKWPTEFWPPTIIPQCDKITIIISAFRMAATYDILKYIHTEDASR